MKEFIKKELSGWKKSETAWLVTATAIILALSLYWKDNLAGIISALTGVWCVIFTGKGKRSALIFGTVNVLLYALVAYKAKFYGEVMLNMIYYLPMNFVAWYAWTKHMNEETGEVVKAKLNRKRSVILYSLTAVMIVVYGCILNWMGGNLPYIDSTTTVISVTAQLLSTWRLKEQWVLWIVVNVVSVIMWGINFMQGGESIATIAMWGVYLINAVMMYVKWSREAENEV